MPYFDREKLYLQVWEQPVSKVAKLYAISDVRLHKICRQLKIPTPPPGHWAKKQAGKKLPPQPRLPLYEGEAVYFQDPEQKAGLTGATPAPPEPEELIKWQLKEGSPELRIEVADTLERPLPAVAAAKKYLLSRDHHFSTDSRGFLQCRGGQHLALNVSKESLDRALRIYNALLKSLKSRQMQLEEAGSNGDRDTHILVMGQRIGIALKERSTRRSYQPTAEELKEEKRRGYSYFPKWAYEPTGELRLEITGGSTIGDERDSKLEDRLNEVIVELIRRALFLKELRKKHAEAEEARQVRAAVAYEQKRQREQEKARLAKLEEESALWRRAECLRVYLNGIRQAIEQGVIAPTTELEEKIAWGLKKADWLDPLVQAPDPILDMKIDSLGLSYGGM